MFEKHFLNFGFSFSVLSKEKEPSGFSLRSSFPNFYTTVERNTKAIAQISVIASFIAVCSARFVGWISSFFMLAMITPGISGKKYLPCKPTIREEPAGVHQTYSEVHMINTLTALNRRMFFRIFSVSFSSSSRIAIRATNPICIEVSSDGR